ncbi:trypsin-like peptidase domain-containing protein [Pirellulaceae bacterium SH501]
MRGWKTVAAALVWTIAACYSQRLLSFENRVGDCVALFFTKADCSSCSSVQLAVQRAIESGWAIRTLDGAREKGLVSRWHIEKYPTVVLIRNGREVDRLIGEPNFDELVRRMLAASSVDSIRVLSASPSLIRGQSPSASVPMAASPSLVSNAATPTSNPISSAAAAAHDSPSVAGPAVGVQAIGSVRSLPRPPSNPAEATVRIRVDEPQHEAIGTGTIIDAYQGEALVLTCGHLFRDTRGGTRIVVETFIGGQPRVYNATLIDFRADEADVGLISFRPEGPVPIARLMDHREKLNEGDAVYSWGCDHGNNPSRRDSRITKLNRYLGAPNVEVYGAPVQGRSGGGLFNSRGELIGVCYAADNELNEGLYNAPEVVYQQLMRLGLNRLFTHPEGESASLATMSSSPTAIAQSPLPDAGRPIPPAPKLTVMLEENGQSRRWEISNPTPELVQSLQNQAIRR